MMVDFIQNEKNVDKQLDGGCNLPFISLGKRIVPNDFIRSSLFTVTNHNIRRDFIKGKELFTFGETKITYTGEELRQDDEDVWMHLLYLISKVHGNKVEFAPYTFLRELSWPARTQYREKLKDSFNRMSATNITIVNKKLNAGLGVSLIRKFAWQDEIGNKLKKWVIWVEHEIKPMFEHTYYTKINWEQRRRLNPLAKWLHSYYSSHAEPFAISLVKLHAASGSKTKAKKHFKSSLRKALFELRVIGFLQDFWIDGKDRVHVTRKKPPVYGRVSDGNN